MFPVIAFFSVLKGSLWREPPGPYIRSRWYPNTLVAVKLFAFTRLVVSVIALVLSDGEPVNASDGIAIKVIGALVAVSAAVEWIPYRLCVWVREPSFLRRRAVPTTSIVCISLATAMCAMTWAVPRRDFPGGKVTRNQVSTQFGTSAAGLIIAALAAVVSNIGLWYYVCSGPAATYFSHYAPTLVKKRRGKEPISTDMGAGPCARLFAQQQSFSEYQYATPTRPVSIAETALISQPQREDAAHYHGALFYWVGAAAPLWTMFLWPFWVMCSFIHLVVQSIRISYVYANGAKCERACALHILYPLLWFIHIAVMMVAIKYRVDFSQRILGPLRLHVLPDFSCIAITAVWIADLAMTEKGTPLFEDKNRFEGWLVGTIVMMVIWSSIATILWFSWGSVINAEEQGKRRIGLMRIDHPGRGERLALDVRF